MKKIIAVFVALAVGSTALFANPASGSKPASLNTQGRQTLAAETEVSKDFALAGFIQAQDPAFQDGDLFADVQAIPLTNEEAQAVEGEGLFGAIWGGIVGAVCGIISGAAAGGIGAVPGGIIGGVLGGIWGAGIGWNY